MDKESQFSNVTFETEINELGSEIVSIKINRNKHKNKQENNDQKNQKEENNNKPNENINENPTEEKTNNNLNEESNDNNNQKIDKKEEFNLDSFNNFLQHNINVQGSSNNNTQLKSHLKPHLKLKKLNLGLGLKKPEVPKPEENKKENDNNNNQNNNNNDVNNPNEIKKNDNDKNNDNINDNININNINEAESLKNSLDQNNKIKDNNIESSFILKQKFNKMNESQISYDATASINNHLKDHKIKKKFKLSLYQLQKITLLGAGSSGEVYLVQDTVTKKKLALKTVKYTEDEKTKTQIETEVKLSTLLKHENIIRIYATYFLKGRINFVMEYMDRGTIADLLKKVKKIPEKFVGLMTCQVLKGLAYCQKDKRIIHRDLKPSNILVNSKGEIKIADFGVSTMVEGSWAQKKTMIGTYIYMAPERIDADCYYINCDVWSLGIIVMECIMGFYPYIIYNNNVLPNSVWIVHELIENNPVPQLDKKIYSQELIDFANLCLIKDTKKRPTAAQLMNHPFIQRYENLGKDDLSSWLKTIN